MSILSLKLSQKWKLHTPTSTGTSGSGYYPPLSAQPITETGSQGPPGQIPTYNLSYENTDPGWDYLSVSL